MRVGIERNVGDGVSLADEPFARFQMPFHHAERIISARAHHRVENSATRIGDIRMHHQVPNARDVRFVAVLLEEEPLKNLCAFESIRWKERRAFRKVRDDRVRFEQQLTVAQFDGGNSAVRKLAKKLRRASLALSDVEFDSLEWNPKLRQDEANFVAVARRQIVVQADHQSSGLEGRNVSPIRYASTARAASRPSHIAHTTSDCPRRVSPAAKTPGTLDM